LIFSKASLGYPSDSAFAVANGGNSLKRVDLGG
jgi:hypothetical protein